MNSPDLRISCKDSDVLIKQTEYYQNLFQAVYYLAEQNIHCLVESKSDLTIQAFCQALRDVFPAAITLDGARPDWPRYLQHARASEISQPVIITGVEKFTPACFARLAALALAPDRVFSGLILLACGADKKALTCGLRPLTISRFLLRRLTERECLAWLERELEQRGITDTGFSSRDKKQLIRAGRRAPEQIRLLMLSTRSYLCSVTPAHVTTGHIRAAIRACYGRWLSGEKTLLLAVLLCLTSGYAAWATKDKNVSWLESQLPTAGPASSAPGLEAVSASREQAMQQLFRVWGYDVTLKEASCENSVRANLFCLTASKNLAALIDDGHPWIAEIVLRDKRYYAVVAGVTGNHVDMLIAGKTWRATESWFSRHATSRVTLFSKLLPSSADKISPRSPAQDIHWLDSKLSHVLLLNPLATEKWSAELKERVKRFQKSAGLQADGSAGIYTVMALNQQTGDAPALKIDRKEE
ncbi:peptidoglycan-binding domain-containing protein [Pantoea osteomyelitidis]|uniref:Peptidoglycan-binding domain-containing protein n=1 Tax=Pantoea osteomyelitidis TaxID=3230026 RepID=A0ABW7PSX1_9GAMM